MVTDADGQPCTSLKSLQDRWIDFFSLMEGGERMTEERLREFWITNLQDFRTAALSLKPDDLPTLVDVEMAFRRIKPGKAIGEDNIPPEVCRGQPREAARLCYTQLLKLLTHGQESLLHKGGVLVAAWKGKGAQSDCSAYRSLLISSHIGKTLHRSLRDRRPTLYEAFLNRHQVGGRKHVHVGLGLHHTRASLRRAKLQHHSSALIFLDLQEAFYRVLRPLAVGGSMPDRLVGDIVRRLNLPPEALHELLWRCCGHLEVLNVQLCLCTCERSCLPYILTPASNSAIRRTGSGLPLGRDRVTRLQMSSSDTFLPASVTFGILLDACSHHGVTPNLSKGKSEVLFAFRGPGSRALRTKYFGPAQGRCLDVLMEYGSCRVSVVGQYKHLGGKAHHSGETKHDMRQRVAQGHVAFGRHRRVLYQNHHLSSPRRMELFVTLVLSKIMYGTESWTLWDCTAKAYFNSAIIRLYKRLLCLPHDAELSDEEVLARASLPSPTTLLRVARLRYLAALYKCEKATPWGVLRSDTQWLTLEFFTYAKLQGHLRRSAVCRGVVQGQGPRFARPAPGRGSAVNETLHRSHDGLLPVQQGLGPISQHGRLRHEDAHHLALYEALALLVFEWQGPSLQHLFLVMQAKIQEHAIGWTQTKLTLQYAAEHLTEEDAELADLPLGAWQELLQRLGGYRMWEFLVDDAHTQCPAKQFALDIFEDWCESLRASSIPFQRHVESPGHIFKEKVVVHAFSGRRRTGDLQWFLEAQGQRHPECLLQVVSLDIVTDPLWGDISRPETLRFWYDAIAAGYVAAFLAGPPCCTWSIARGKVDESMHRLGRSGPRVLRSAAQLWGFHSASLREKRQLLDGHRLLSFSIVCMVLLYLTDGVGLVEHPDLPADETAASIWRLPLLRFLLTLPGFEKYSLAQGLFGASSTKRTGLLSLSLPHLPMSLRRFFVCAELPSGSNIGVDASGSFKTAVLKEYPPALCGGFAEGFMYVFLAKGRGRQSIPPEVLHRMQAMICSQHGTKIGRDYAGK
eukprot:s880_g25.t1